MRRAGGLLLIVTLLALVTNSAWAEEQYVLSVGQSPFVVPAGVTGLHVEATAAGGGAGAGYTARAGGSGALVNGNVPVTPGSTLYVTNGGRGQNATASPGAGGSNGGASGNVGFSGSFESGTPGGGGGGATDLRTLPIGDPDSLLSRLIVAGGGGGGGGSSVTTNYGTGGLGGPAGSAGFAGSCGSSGGGGGQPGTAGQGGAGGTPPNGGGAGTDGSLGAGGPGGAGQGNGVLGSNGGGGAGGGYYGGGGGAGSNESCGGGGGGGGGSNYFAPQVTQTQASSGGSNDGYTRLDWMPANGGGDVVISQIYTGAGAGGASAYTQNFVELFNRSDHDVSLNGWALQYNDAVYAFWTGANLPNVTLQPGDYFLVQVDPHNPSGQADLPTPDLVVAAPIANIPAHVALTSNTTVLNGYCPTRTAAIVDFVGFGSTVPCFEGAGPGLRSDSLAAPVRQGAGCIDTDDNAANFSTSPYPAPRNTASPPGNCFLPVNITPPAMSGTPAPGNTLQCSPGTWTSSPDTLEYRFVRSSGGGDYFPINGSASAGYVVQDADIGSRIACEEIATNATGTGDPARSNSKGVAAGVPENVTAPILAGKAVVGQGLSCSTGDWTNGATSFHRQWLADSAPIPGETGNQHTVTMADRGKHISCEVTASNDVGTGVPSRSNSRFAVFQAPVNQSPPTLTLVDVGARPTDKEARCDPGTWSDDSGDYTFTVERAGAEVVGTDRVYPVKAADLGKQLTCTVTASNDAGSSTRTSDSTTVPLPPIDPKAGPAHMFKAGGTTNEFEPVNLLATSDGLQKDLDAQQLARVQGAFDKFMADCRTRTLDPGLPTRDPRTIVDKTVRENETCRLLLNTPPEQIKVGFDGVRIVADPSKCVLGTNDPCAVVPIPMPPASNALTPVGVDTGVVPERILWDFNSDGVLDADCPGSAPVARTIFRPGNYNVRAILVLPGSEESGQYPSTTLTLSHFPPNPPPGGVLIKYTPGGLSATSVIHLRAHAAGGFASPFSTSIPSEINLKLGQIRKAQPFACRTSLAVPVATPKPCVAEGFIGKVRVQGNLCPISLRSIPNDEVQALKKSDPDVYDLLVAQNEALDVEAAAARKRPPPAFASADLATGARSAFNLAAQQFASPVPTSSRLSRSITSAVEKLNLDVKQAPVALDQIYISRGVMNVNGVKLDPKLGSAVVMIPSDVGDMVKSVKQMTVSASDVTSKLGDITLDPKSAPFKQAIDDAASSAPQLFKQADLDALKGDLLKKLNLGPFKLAGHVDIKLADGVAILTAKAELPALLTEPGSDPVRTTVTIRAQPDGKIKLDGVRLQVGQAYLGAVKVRGLDLNYDGGLTIRGQLLFPPNDAGIEIKEFRLDNTGAFKALSLAYLAGAGTGIPIGPGVFLTKLGGGFSLDPDEIDAQAAVSVGPSAGGGCPVVGADGRMLVHFGPTPFYVSTNVDMQIVCLSLAHVDFYVRQDGYASLGASMSFDAGPLYFNAGMKGQILLPNWQISGQGEGGIHDILEATIKAVVSNRGLAGCGTLETFLGDISAGAAVRFNPTILAGAAGIFSNVHLFWGCDLSGYNVVVARASADASRTVRVDKGERALVLSAEGLGAAPKVTLKGPDGTTVDLATTNAHKEKGRYGLRVENEDRTVFLIGQPAAGVWTIEPAEDSVRVVKVTRAHVLAKPKVKVRLRRAGAARILTWSVKRQSGQVVRFVEQGVRGGQPIATVKVGGRGSKRFIPADAAKRGRAIVAQVEQDGLPRDNIVVARFSAPSPKVGTARGLRVKRRGAKALVSWRPAFLAVRYDVVVARSDGSRAVVSPAKGKRTVSVRLGKRQSLRVKVIGISTTGKRGRPARAKLAAPRKKTHAKRRARR